MQPDYQILMLHIEIAMLENIPYLKFFHLSELIIEFPYLSFKISNPISLLSYDLYKQFEMYLYPYYLY